MSEPNYSYCYEVLYTNTFRRLYSMTNDIQLIMLISTLSRQFSDLRDEILSTKRYLVCDGAVLIPYWLAMKLYQLETCTNYDTLQVGDKKKKTPKNHIVIHIPPSFRIDKLPFIQKVPQILVHINEYTYKSLQGVDEYPNVFCYSYYRGKYAITKTSSVPITMKHPALYLDNTLIDPVTRHESNSDLALRNMTVTGKRGLVADIWPEKVPTSEDIDIYVDKLFVPHSKVHNRQNIASILSCGLSKKSVYTICKLYHIHTICREYAGSNDSVSLHEDIYLLRLIYSLITMEEKERVITCIKHFKCNPDGYTRDFLVNFCVKYGIIKKTKASTITMDKLIRILRKTE